MKVGATRPTFILPFFRHRNESLKLPLARAYIYKVWKPRGVRVIKNLSPFSTMGEGAEVENDGAGPRCVRPCLREHRTAWPCGRPEERGHPAD